MEIGTLIFFLIVICLVLVHAATHKQRDGQERDAKLKELRQWEETIEERGLDIDFYEKELKWEAEISCSTQGSSIRAIIEATEKELILYGENKEL
tara:strand:+ start:81 stop:365 length:285 start_codon:yes stop_codon:yes gene_type:complete